MVEKKEVINHSVKLNDAVWKEFKVSCARKDVTISSRIESFILSELKKEGKLN